MLEFHADFFEASDRAFQECQSLESITNLIREAFLLATMFNVPEEEWS